MDAGYQRIKVKIKPGWDVNVLERIRHQFPSIALMADANSAYTLADLPHLKLFDRFFLMMVEQPLGWEDLVDHAKLQRELGWEPRFQSLDAILESAWKWHQKFPRGYED